MTRLAGLLLLLFVASRACMAQQVVGCQWINHATASGVLGGDSVDSLDSSKPGTSACSFKHRGKNSHEALEVTVTTISDPAEFATSKAQCSQPSTPLKAVGNEALLCRASPVSGGSSQRVVGRVRNRVFSVTLSTIGDASPLLEQDVVETRLKMVAEQVAGNLF